MELKELIEKAWADRELLKSAEIQTAVREVIELLDKGKVRVAEPDEPLAADEIFALLGLIGLLAKGAGFSGHFSVGPERDDFGGSGGEDTEQEEC